MPSVALPLSVEGRHLSLAELEDVVDRYAAGVRAGAHVAEFPAGERWHVRIHQDDDVDVWLISWTTDQSTELHDHGGSSGAFAVIEGTLEESVWADRGVDGPGLVVSEARLAGDLVTFGPDHVHDVGNHHTASAVSVHAYSPPIRLMQYYDVESGRLRQTGSSWTDDPESAAVAVAV